jgi:hypothetical protein
MLETYHAYSLTKALTLTATYQLITNAVYNADRGPARVFSGRFGGEFERRQALSGVIGFQLLTASAWHGAGVLAIKRCNVRELSTQSVLRLTLPGLRRRGEPLIPVTVAQNPAQLGVSMPKDRVVNPWKPS